jgi:hypothetical protein
MAGGLAGHPGVVACDTLLPTRPCVQGCLIPPAHSGYWFGLNTNEEPKNINSWFWIDRSPPPTPTTYVKWGTRKPQNIPEPANLMGAETCGASNFSEAFAGTWGWASQQCKQELVYMCEQNREWHARQRGGVVLRAAMLTGRCVLQGWVLYEQLPCRCYAWHCVVFVLQCKS